MTRVLSRVLEVSCVPPGEQRLHTISDKSEHLSAALQVESGITVIRFDLLKRKKRKKETSGPTTLYTSALQFKKKDEALHVLDTGVLSIKLCLKKKKASAVGRAS